MIAFLEGKISTLSSDSIIINVNGVGYYVLISRTTYDALSSSKGKSHQILIYHHITDSSQSLFGFIDEEERTIFKLLISVSGIGPKTGIQMLSSISAKDLKERIITGEVELLTSIQGIGTKTAKRIIIELKEKFTSLSSNDMPVEDSLLENPSYKDAFEALVVLGYNKKEINNTISNIIRKDGDIQAPDLIKKVLNKIGKG